MIETKYRRNYGNSSLWRECKTFGYKAILCEAGSPGPLGSWAVRKDLILAMELA